MSVCDSGTANQSELEVLRQRNTELEAKVAELEKLGTISLRTLNLLNKDILSPSFEALLCYLVGMCFIGSASKKPFYLHAKTTLNAKNKT
ncbi:hypothetical protein RhiirA4_398173 [Rhizophagus irregularis]|uniref:Uncharacterized protein n=1 Tax=Rhizophagus irregularis TaxID=588596 RepID=A0A2I1G8P4_9GLOM|nr:hypothetical protein RhiirA4_398173 [Rhizophagus irregularis]